MIDRATGLCPRCLDVNLHSRKTENRLATWHVRANSIVHWIRNRIINIDVTRTTLNETMCDADEYEFVLREVRNCKSLRGNFL